MHVTFHLNPLDRSTKSCLSLIFPRYFSPSCLNNNANSNPNKLFAINDLFLIRWQSLRARSSDFESQRFIQSPLRFVKSWCNFCCTFFCGCFVRYFCLNNFQTSNMRLSNGKHTSFWYIFFYLKFCVDLDLMIKHDKFSICWSDSQVQNLEILQKWKDSNRMITNLPF